MKLTPIEVECYAGIKADETPRRFSWEGQAGGKASNSKLQASGNRQASRAGIVA